MFSDFTSTYVAIRLPSITALIPRADSSLSAYHTNNMLYIADDISPGTFSCCPARAHRFTTCVSDVSTMCGKSDMQLGARARAALTGGASAGRRLTPAPRSSQDILRSRHYIVHDRALQHGMGTLVLRLRPPSLRVAAVILAALLFNTISSDLGIPG